MLQIYKQPCFCNFHTTLIIEEVEHVRDRNSLRNPCLIPGAPDSQKALLFSPHRYLWYPLIMYGDSLNLLSYYQVMRGLQKMYGICKYFTSANMT